MAPRRLLRIVGSERGITGIESAIILIAVVVVASVFAYTVLTSGIFTAQTGKDAINAALTRSSGTLTTLGGVVLKDSGGPTGSTAGDDQVDQVVVTVSLALDDGAVDMTSTVDSDNDGDLSDETGLTHTTIAAYLDATQRVDDLAWTAAEVGVGDGDALLDPGEQWQVTFNVSQLGTALGVDTEFSIEFKPRDGGMLTLRRTTPEVIDNIMYLY